MKMHGVKNGHGRVAHAPFPQSSPSTPARPGASGSARDQIQLSSAEINPYEGIANKAVSVKVDGWKKGPNDCLEHILRNQGYSQQEIYQQNDQGLSLIERVAQVNGLKDPNLVATHSKLVVPTKKLQQTEVGPQENSPKPRLRPDTRKGAEVLMSLNRPRTRPADAPPRSPSTPGRNFVPARPAKGAELLMSRSKQAASSSPRAEAELNQPKPAQSPGPVEAPVGQAESLEVDMLLKGVQEGKFTRQEFQALNSTANQYNELRANYSKNGLTPKRGAQLAQVQQQYGQMYSRFLADDAAKIRFSGERDKSPAARFHQAQNQQAGQLYDLYRQQSLSQAQFKNGLMSQREAAGQRGLDYTDQTRRPVK